MKRIINILGAFALLTTLAACGPSGNDPGPGNVSVDEAQALDDAAEMIEDQRLPPEALPQELQPDAPVELPPENATETSQDD